jgi:hypothetical protein
MLPIESYHRPFGLLALWIFSFEPPRRFPSYRPAVWEMGNFPGPDRRERRERRELADAAIGIAPALTATITAFRRRR